MGYRSDVTFAFYSKERKPELFPAIKLWVEENWPDDAISSIEVLHDTGIILVKYESVKWYDGFDYVTAAWAATEQFDEAFDTASYEDHRACWDYVRIGEEDDDTERGGSEYREYRLGVERSIIVY